MIPLGAQVRWRPDVYKAPPIGTVTARKGRMLDIDGRGWWVSEGLLEVVGMNEHEVEFYAASCGVLEAERDALQAVVVQQCEAMAELSAELADMREAVKDAQDERDAADEINAENLAGVREDLKRFEAEVTYRVEDLLLVFMGERRPARPIEPPELRRLVEFVFEGVS